MQQDLSLTAEFVGTIDGYVNAEIRARVKGFLKTQDYQDGAFVKKGQLLFTIDPSEYQAAVAKAKGAVARAQAAYGQAKVTVGPLPASRREAGGEPAGPRRRGRPAARDRGEPRSTRRRRSSTRRS